MKKIFVTSFVLICTSLQITHAENCLIENKMGESLSEYIKTNKEVLSSIQKDIKKPKEKKDNAVVKKGKNSLKDITSRIMGAYNSTFNFTNYFATIEVETELPKSVEIPKEIKRDLEKLKDTGKEINQLMEQLMRSKSSQDIIEDFCEDFKEKECSIPKNIRREELMKMVMINYKNVESNFLNTVLGETAKLKDINFVDKNFNTELQKYYAPENFSKCNEKEGSFLDSVTKKTQEISNANNDMNTGISEWKEAWNMLLGKDSAKTKIRETEKRVLREELSKQGVTRDNQTNMLKNLEKYNSTGFSENNNFISNTFNSTRRKIDENLAEFRSEVLGDFTESFGKQKESTTVDTSKKISLQDIKTAKKNSTDSKAIKQRVDTLYSSLLPYTGISENKTDNLHARIINTHMEMSNAINILKESCKKSVKICNQQDYGNGNCGKCQ